VIDLKDAYFFVQIVERKGFSAASDFLGVHKSTLSLRMKELESSLGVRLLNRTSRQFMLTDVGTDFYHQAKVLLADAQRIEDAIRARASRPSGTVKLSSTVEVSQYLLQKLLPDFMSRYPEVTIQEYATDKLVDLIADGFDLTIRGHSEPLQDSGLVQRPLAKAPWYLFAAPQLLQHGPALSAPALLSHHPVVGLSGHGVDEWLLTNEHGDTVRVPVHCRYQGNNLVSAKSAACAGLGVAALPVYMCREELQTGALQQVLHGWTSHDAKLTALMPSRTGNMPAVKALLEFLVASFPKLTALD
jgi:DNA-binding transcriptional LysR family regulator